MIKDEMDKKFQAINVFSLSIAYLVENMLSTCQNAIAGGICKSDIHWVLTVPAIWSDAAKQFMREAAEKHPVTYQMIKRINDFLKSYWLNILNSTPEAI